MKITTPEKRAFEAARKALYPATEHQKNCRYEKTSIPLNECRCHCYDLQVFAIGYRQCQVRTEKALIAIGRQNGKSWIFKDLLTKVSK